MQNNPITYDAVETKTRTYSIGSLEYSDGALNLVLSTEFSLSYVVGYHFKVFIDFPIIKTKKLTCSKNMGYTLIGATRR